MADYRYEPYQNRYAGAIAGTLREMGESRARAALQVADAQARATQARGDVWGQAIGNIGQSIASIPAQMQQAERNKAAAAEDAMRAKVLQGQVASQQQEQAVKAQRAGAMRRTSRADVLEALKSDPEGYKIATEHFQRLDDSVNRTMGTAAAGVRAFKDSPQAAIAALDDLMDKGFDEKRLTALRMQIIERPESVTQLVDSLLAKSPEDDHRKMISAAPKPAEGFTLSEGQQRFGPNGQVIASVPKPAKPAADAAPGSFGDYLTRVGKPLAEITAAEMRKHKADYEAAGRAPAAEKSRLWVVRDGETMRVSENEIRPGDRPANTREQGRPVTSGDASDLADFDTSLDELKAVRAAISDKDSTGIVARVGATLPYVTQITGWGADAKKRQAVIDRVKQVIGKTLEGGVLRKEDEAKYEKILPNIGDAPEVAASKLNGLDAAIATRKQRRLDALADANYDVSKYAARPTAPPKVGEPVKVGGFTVKVK